MTAVTEFFAMGGHGPFIWGSYGVALGLMALETWLVVARKRKALNLLKRAEQREGGVL